MTGGVKSADLSASESRQEVAVDEGIFGEEIRRGELSSGLSWSTVGKGILSGDIHID
jgi:hypothetical protein